MQSSRYMTVAAIMAIATATAQLAQAATPVTFNAPADVAAIQQVESVLATEIDIDKVLPYYADNAVVLDLFAPGMFQGKAAIRAGFAPQMAVIKSMKVAAPEVTIATDGEFGCAASQFAYDTVMKDGSTFKMNLRELDALKKIDGKWVVVQQHLSFPVDPATMTAMTSAPIQPRTLNWSATPLGPIATTPEKAKAEIREYMDVGGASVGLDKLMNYYGPGDDTLLYDAFSPKAIIGRMEIAEYYGPIMSSYTAVNLTMPMFTADSDGSFGIQIDTQHLTLSMKDGSKRNVALRQSDCMRRVDGKWYSFMEMISYPTDAKTMKAQMSY